MKYLLGLLYMIISCHLSDASFHYFLENEMRSFILNFILSLISLIMGIYLLFNLHVLFGLHL